MAPETRAPTALAPACGTSEDTTELRHQPALINTEALQNAILDSPNDSSIATDDEGVIQSFNVGAERMPGYAATDVLNQITPAGTSDPEKLAQLFHPFNRLGQESSSEEGTGIGLVRSKLPVEQLGGSIGVESTVGVGTVFWIEPGSTSAPQLAVDKVQPAAEPPAQVSPGAPVRTLLHVEDDTVNLKLVERLGARRSDMHLMTAAHGSPGIELARDNQPDVILININLPGINGYQALRILRDDPATAHIPVLAINANAMQGDIERGLEAGFFRHLARPINVKEFIEPMAVALDSTQLNQTRTMVESDDKLV